MFRRLSKKKWSRKKPADRTRVHCAELRFTG